MRRTRKSATKGPSQAVPSTSALRSGFTTMHVCSPAEGFLSLVTVGSLGQSHAFHLALRSNFTTMHVCSPARCVSVTHRQQQSVRRTRGESRRHGNMGLRCRRPHMMRQGSTEAAAGTSFPQQLPSHSQTTGGCEHMAAEATSAADTHAVDRVRSETCSRTRHVRSCLAQVQRLVAGAPPEVEQRLREAEGGAQVLQRLCGALARRLQQRRQPAARPAHLLLQPAACMTGSECVIRRKTGLDWRAI